MKWNIAVMFGGGSVEHEVSVISGIQAIMHLDKEKYNVVPVYITKDSEMFAGPDVGNIEAYRDIPGLLKRSQRVFFFREAGEVYLLPYPVKRKTKGTRFRWSTARRWRTERWPGICVCLAFLLWVVTWEHLPLVWTNTPPR